MTTAQMIAEHIETLPEEAQREVLDFVAFLEAKTRSRGVPESGLSWCAFSLASAMRGMEDEDTPYTLADMKESFR